MSPVMGFQRPEIISFVFGLCPVYGSARKLGCREYRWRRIADTPSGEWCALSGIALEVGLRFFDGYWLLVW